MKLILHLLLLTSALIAQETLIPPSPGVRITVEISSDLINWQMAMPYNTPRGFIRARTDTVPAFGAWTSSIDALPSGDKTIFASGVRNANCWGASIDLTPMCITPKAGVLISPRHVLFVTHWHPDVNESVSWMTANSQTITRTITGLVSLTDTANLFPDLTVALLDADVTEVSFAQVVVASSLTDWTGFRVPVLLKDQDQNLLCADVQKMVTDRVWLTPPLAENRAPYFETMISGDSGTPVFVTVNNQMALLCLISIGGNGRGTLISSQATAINAAMTSLGGGYQLTMFTP